MFSIAVSFIVGTYITYFGVDRIVRGRTILTNVVIDLCSKRYAKRCVLLQCETTSGDRNRIYTSADCKSYKEKERVEDETW